MSQKDRAGAGTLNPGEQGKYTKELVILTSLFFMWGLITCLNDILIPHLKAVFSLNYAQAMLIQFCFFGAYFIVSAPSGFLTRRVGYKRGIIIGLIVAGLGCILFYPSASLRSYPLFLSALFILASGITLLQVSANPYVTVLGNPDTASSRLTLTQAFNSLGTTIAPFFGSMLILSLAVKSTEELAGLSQAELDAYRQLESASVQVPYLGLAIALFVIAAAFSVFRFPPIRDEVHAEDTGCTDDALRKSAWEYRHLVLGAIAIFVYVGGEVAIGSFLVNFISDPHIAGLSRVTAGAYVSYYWGGAMVGRFIGSAILQKIKPAKVLGFNAAAAASLVALTMMTSGRTAMVCILLVGLFNSIMFPTIFSLSVRGLGRHTYQGSGILCMAIVGGAIIPTLQGFIADYIGIQKAFMLPLLCYLYIMVFAVRASAVKPVSGKEPARGCRVAEQ